ncbi:TylF/MycF/NovP-related O-methyltransferase [Photorhabdus heterorhabditis]|uniref:Class I SAM-dependent methyltransferase n=1 Tax=Photorhabdus heterorhabditis TaxID=880156 RepID=A0A5B0WLF0_9GAMM|nr:TylF/MycF/NovP-related O-methyltransferase [Photorhabdus heterorhabditis]KAA1187904.1 hypothetical protein F0L16_12240 [Photorhabdus heterorhabditis]KOY63271.1 hypothetical protein AM629_03965 [Photorhabdus heterorhabditis]MBS9440215.1 hypothetical protein [Photorhabdus heterorhabditis]
MKPEKEIIPFFPEMIQKLINEGKDPHYYVIQDFMEDKSLSLSELDKQSLVNSHYLISKKIISPHSTEDIFTFIKEILSIPSSREGCIVEAGSYKGSSTAKFSLAAKLAGRELVVCDSFMGLPFHNEVHGISIEGREAVFREGDFAGSFQEVKNNIIKYGNISSCTFIKGWFETSLVNWSRPIAAIYLDVDLQKSTRDCLKYLYPWLTPGGSLYSQDGHLPLVLDVFEDVNFWRNEIGTQPPTVVGIRKKKLIKITKPDTPFLPLL